MKNIPESEQADWQKALEVGDDEIKEFFETHQAIDKSKFEREAGIPLKTVRHFLNGTQGIPEKHRKTIIDRMVFYGYDYFAYMEATEK